MLIVRISNIDFTKETVFRSINIIWKRLFELFKTVEVTVRKKTFLSELQKTFAPERCETVA